MLERTGPFALLLLRVVVGVVFVVHGFNKFFVGGMGEVTASFEKLGIPLPSLAAPAVAGIELLGGIALILGAALPVAGVLLALVMLGAIVFVHGGKGLLAQQGGYEYVLVLAAVSLAIGFTGGGAFALDNRWQRGRTLAAPRSVS
jgi:putative oxidoreductase